MSRSINVGLRPASWVASVATMAIVLGACGTAQSDSVHSTPRVSSSSASFAAFVQEVRRFHYDYEPAPHPADLTRMAHLVVTGRIVDVQSGQQYAPEAGARAIIATSVLVVEITDIIAGDESLVQLGRVYVEVPHPAFVGIPGGGKPDTPEEVVAEVPYDTGAFAKSVPRTSGVFFLQERTDDFYSQHLTNAGAGRPAGAPLTTYYTQGLWVVDDAGRLVSVAEPATEMPAAWDAIDTLEELLASVSRTVEP